jgi:hypothetical protein
MRSLAERRFVKEQLDAFKLSTLLREGCETCSRSASCQKLPLLRDSDKLPELMNLYRDDIPL